MTPPSVDSLKAQEQQSDDSSIFENAPLPDPRSHHPRWQSEKAQDYGLAGKMLLDTEDNRYLIPDVHKRPTGDRQLFLKYIYW